MTYDERLSNVSVLGAAGKMGSGILLLTAIEMTDLSLLPENKDKVFVLNAIDISDAALKGLIEYVRVQTRKFAEKKIVWLREMYKDNPKLVHNAEIIDDYINKVVQTVRPSKRMEAAYDSYLIFEAVNENPELKVKLFTQIDENNPNEPWFFTNTSSVPIHYLNEKANLGGRIIGFHFYNPPAVQKLVELIAADATLPEVVDFAREYAKKLKKFVVDSNDFAGFIGNGHFMRDALYGIQTAERLMKEENYSFPEAIYAVNKVTQDFMIRPMGIFQLLDYVGIDVCKYIMSVMNPYLSDEDLHSDLLDSLFEKKILGGQNSDGSQKDGLFKYEKGKITAVYDYETDQYEDVEPIAAKIDAKLGELPEGHIPWKKIIRDKNRNEKLTRYFSNLEKTDTAGARLAKRYLKNSRAIGLKLVSDGVANSEEDVNNVMLTGFFHAYGPINDFLNWEEIK
jgi:3-hydroxyacyl-CoA dehydrogenase